MSSKTLLNEHIVIRQRGCTALLLYRTLGTSTVLVGYDYLDRNFLRSRYIRTKFVLEEFHLGVILITNTYKTRLRSFSPSFWGVRILERYCT